MATMVKEKRRQKKKNKEKNLPEIGSSHNDRSLSESVANEEDIQVCSSEKESEQNIIEVTSDASNEEQSHNVTTSLESETSFKEAVRNENSEEGLLPPSDIACSMEQIESLPPKVTETNSYKDLNLRLERLAIPEQSFQIDEARVSELEHSDAFLQSDVHSQCHEATEETASPSAPVFEVEAPQVTVPQEILHNEIPKVQCMPLDEAMRLYGGAEIAAVKEMSAREQAEVETGPRCGPDHPLVDLLTTFRSSLRAVEQERSRLASNFDEEERYRATLWKIEKKNINLHQTCHCGLDVNVRASYEHAELLKDRLPIAKLKLEGLLRDVQESYCHHQHAALLAHCQIEDFISEIMKSNKVEIRNALFLILQALRVSDGAPEALPAALQRWAEILAGALVDDRDLRQLLFLMHHLFRQTRSVRWAARVFDSRVSDSITAARTIAVIDILLSHLHPEVAVECNEETEEAWEEVDIKGGDGAVSSGTLRERDLIALLQALPLQQLIAKMLLFSHADFKEATLQSWGDASGGSGLLKACCGVRVLLSVLQRAITAHPVYTRLHQLIRNVARSALTALAYLYTSPRAPYQKELEEKITAELEAAFAAAFALFGTHELHTLPTGLLTEHSARDYCLNFIVGLHDDSPKTISSLSITAPVLSCGARVRVVARAAAGRTNDHDLARIVLDFLLQTGLKRNSATCKGTCAQTARECVPELLTVHPYLYATALYIVADLSQVETLFDGAVSVVCVDRWRPQLEELRAVLQHWAQRCPAMLQQLLAQLNYTPHVGLPLPQQLFIANFLLQYSRTDPQKLEASWSILMSLRTHLAWWGVGGEPAPPEVEPSDPFSMAHAVLATDWGYSLPLICSMGVSALCALCETRVRETVHCLEPVMMMMALSPESLSLTPKFAELFTVLLSSGPSLVQRALGRGGEAGSQRLLRLLLTQLTDKQLINRCAIFPAWLHALWSVQAALPVLDVGALAAKDCRALDHHADYIIQNDPNLSQFISTAVRNVTTAPLLCESLLRRAHHREGASNLFPALLSVLNEQRRASQKIHVDKALVVAQLIHINISRKRPQDAAGCIAPLYGNADALRQILTSSRSLNSGTSSEGLMIYQAAKAATNAPFDHVSHLALWRLFLVMYLERPTGCDLSTPICGPLFFSGIRKSPWLTQLKNRLKLATSHHQIESKLYKNRTESTPPNNRVPKSIPPEDSLLPALTIADLTGESIASDSDEKVETVTDDSMREAIEIEKRRNNNMAAYHTGAERLLLQYLHWLEEGENVREGPLHADIARFIPAQAMDAAYEHSLSLRRPPPSPEKEDPPHAPPQPEISRTPLDIAVASIQSVTCRANRVRRKLRPREAVSDDIDYSDVRSLLARVERLLKDIEKYAQEWSSSVSRVCSLHGRLWELVAALRVPRPLPPVARACANHCKPITFHLDAHEWCISAGAELGIAESRRASIAGMRRLTRARPQLAQMSAALHAVTRRCRSAAQALPVLEAAWPCAGRLAPCPAASTALAAPYELLAERWITKDGKLCLKLLSKAKKECNALQQALCGSLVAPRALPLADWPAVYTTLLQSQLPPHTIFSYISRFEMHRLSENAESNQRIYVLDALFEAVKRFGPDPAASVLIEILGVHVTSVSRCQDLYGVLVNCCILAREGRLPLSMWRHLNKALETHAHQMDLDEVGNTLRCVGQVWPQTDATGKLAARHAEHAPHVAQTLRVLGRALLAAALKLTYEPNRAGGLACAAMLEAWLPWVQPTGILPRPPPAPAADHYAAMVERFTYCLTELMTNCPGSEARILRDSYSWSINIFKANFSQPLASIQAYVMILLEQMSKLPWREHQWFDAECCLNTLEVLAREEYHDVIRRWCCDRFVSTRAETFLVGVDDNAICRASFLEQLIKLFTGNLYVNDPELLREAAKVPWSELREDSVLQAMWGFFQTHSQGPHMYHETPQAHVILSVCELRPGAFSSVSVTKRQHALVQWNFALQHPAVRRQGPPFSRFMLQRLTELEPYLQKPDEVQDLLYRLAQVMSTDDAATVDTLAVWQQWLTTAPACMLSACVALCSQLTVLTVASRLAVDSIRTYLHNCDGGWAEIRSMWQSAVFKPHLYAEKGALLAAYASHIAGAGETRPLLTSLLVLTEQNFDFVKNEVMVAVWICCAAREVAVCDVCRTEEATEIPSSPGGMEPLSETEECKHAALSLLSAWGAQQRRSLLQVVTLQADTERPTARHRALVRFADCLLTPSPASTQAYESACAGLPCDVTWARAPTLNKLVRLAIRLYSTHEKYFSWEMEQTKE